MHTLSHFQYDLPEKLIARTPLEKRDHCRLLVLSRTTGELSHKKFYDLVELLQQGDVLVRNDSKVIKARLFGFKTGSGGRVEIVLNSPISASQNEVIYDCIVKPGVRIGQQLTFGENELMCTCVGFGDDGYTRHLKFACSELQLLEHLEKLGSVPLPPYMHHDATTANTFAEQYQTQYATEPGSVAAPTAGLHFTSELDARLRAKGVVICTVTLHVGLGTFLPVKIDDITKHTMHSERYTLTPEAARTISEAKNAGRRIIAVGTTTCRVLESAAVLLPDGTIQLEAAQTTTQIFIYPPYAFKVVDALITNFHLPESTLLMLITAFVTAPQTIHTAETFLETSVGAAYREAIKHEYRFFSFGDALCIF